MHRLRVIVNAALPVGAAMSQAIHAAVEFTFQHPEFAAAWHAQSNTVVVLEAPADALAFLIDEARWRGIPLSVFYEPDMGGALTAIALAPCTEANRLCRRLDRAGTRCGRRESNPQEEVLEASAMPLGDSHAAPR